MYLILAMHGETSWDTEHRFTGWTDVDLNDKGCKTARESGNILKKLNTNIGIAYTSVLNRDAETLKYIEESLGEIKTRTSYKLNDRHYGTLQGRTREEIEAEFGEATLDLWSKSYDKKSPELDITDPRFPGNDPKYGDVLKFELPLSESLKDTEKRVLEYFEDEISTFLRVGENVLIVAGDSVLRILVRYLEKITEENIFSYEIKPGEVIIYEIDDTLKIIKKTLYNSSKN